MIVNNAASRRDVAFWTKHLLNDEKNERAELREIRGLAAGNLHDALLEMQQDASHAPRCKNFMYHADFNPRREERLTEEQWERAFEIFEKRRGIPAGQPRVVVEHEKEGRVHRHVIWLRVDLETLRAFPDGLDWRVAHAAAREIEKELGLKRTIGPLDREPGTPRPKRAPEAWEMYRGMKTGIDPRDITAEVTALFHQSDNSKSFQAALEQQGYMLLKGDRRGFLILDNAGKEHSLARRLDGVNTKELKAFMRDVDREALPTLQQGKAQYQERKIAGLEAERATVLREIKWEEALAKAAIEKEKTDRQFIDPEKKRAERAGSREERKWPTMSPQAERKHWTDFEKAAKEAIHDKRPENLKGAAAHIWTAWRQSHTSKALDADIVWPNPHQSYKIDAKAFAAALDEKGIAFAVVTKEEAARSHRGAEFAKAVGNYAPRFKESEIVAVTGPRLQYQRDGEIIEPRRLYKLDQSMASKFVAALDNRGKLQGIDATKQALNERAHQRSAHWQSLRLENAIKKTRTPPTRAGKIRVPSIVKKAPLREVGKVLDVIGSAFESILAPKLTPEQIRQGERAAQKREAEAEHSIDFSKYTGELAQERRNREQEREAERRQHRERDGGGRDR